MKKTINIILVITLVISVFSACRADNSKGKMKYDLYFSNYKGDNLVTETGFVDEKLNDNTVELVKEVMSNLLKGPSAEGAKRVIPKGVALRGVSLSDEEEDTVNIDLSKEYYTNISKDSPPSEELLARYSIICTLCQFDKIKKVKIYIDGMDMMSSSGNDGNIPPMGLNNVMINSPSSVETKTEKFVTLYFTDKNGTNLYPETHKATMTDNSLEKTIVNELIRGPVSNGFERTFPESTRLISAETTEGVCFVNFSSDFMTKSQDNQIAIKTSVYSVVNSLTRLPDIEKVQILIDGKKPENDVNQLFSMPLGRDESMIIDIK